MYWGLLNKAALRDLVNTEVERQVDDRFIDLILTTVDGTFEDDIQLATGELDT